VSRGRVFQINGAVNAQSPRHFIVGGFANGEPGGDLLSHMKYALSSAYLRFTVLFGMGRGGSKGLLPPSITGSHTAESGVRKTGRRWVL
jgi:hypothetical protein